VAGAFAVAVAVVLVFTTVASAHGRDGGTWVVARTELPAGTRITAGDLTTATLGLGSGATAGSAYRSAGALVGRTVAVDVGSGQLMLRSELAPPGAAASLRPVPVTVSSADVVDLAAGDLVDVLVTPTNGHGTSVVLRGARVLAVASPSESLASSGQGDVVTVGVRTLAEAESLVGAEHGGTLDLIVGEASDGSGVGAAGGSSAGAGGSASAGDSASAGGSGR